MKPLVLLLAASFAVAPAFSQDAAPADGAAPAAKRGLLKYTPPKAAAGGARIDGDGGSRGPDVKLPSISVLAPKEAAVTTNEAPSLFWFQNGPMPEKVIKTARVEVTLLDPKNPKPLLKVTSPLAGDKQAGSGLRRVALGKQKVSLQPGVTYKWTVALVPDPANRSQDVITSASIQRVEIALDQGRLERRTYAMVDGATAGPAMVLADNVENVRLRYRDKGVWAASWQNPAPASMPKAVELIVKRQGQPALMMAFLVGANVK